MNLIYVKHNVQHIIKMIPRQVQKYNFLVKMRKEQVLCDLCCSEDIKKTEKIHICKDLLLCEHCHANLINSRMPVDEYRKKYYALCDSNNYSQKYSELFDKLYTKKNLPKESIKPIPYTEYVKLMKPIVEEDVFSELENENKEEDVFSELKNKITEIYDVKILTEMYTERCVKKTAIQDECNLLFSRIELLSEKKLDYSSDEEKDKQNKKQTKIREYTFFELENITAQIYDVEILTEMFTERCVKKTAIQDECDLLFSRIKLLSGRELKLIHLSDEEKKTVSTRSQKLRKLLMKYSDK